MTVAEAEVEGQALTLKVDLRTEGFRIRHRGADLEVRVRSARTAELAALMPVKLPPDTSKQLLCPMPGIVVSIAVTEGERVQEGQILCTVEAMKMENVLRAERAATVQTIRTEAGQSLSVDEVILEFE
jgi:propionyl-CoA carboxylase alpha chain